MAEMPLALPLEKIECKMWIILNLLRLKNTCRYVVFGEGSRVKRSKRENVYVRRTAEKEQYSGDIFFCVGIFCHRTRTH
jgi:hypothetical protein